MLTTVIQSILGHGPLALFIAQAVIIIGVARALGLGVRPLSFALFLGTALSATELIGIHALFGAFMFGVLMPKDGGFEVTLADRLEDFAAGAWGPKATIRSVIAEPGQAAFIVELPARAHSRQHEDRARIRGIVHP